ncbi:hypothetical protein F4802DRAFT_600564 [Xylaria palmicola]|nr:hypothetical protein F4802DRAFT_600564 [Xylaria palmicola]
MLATLLPLLAATSVIAAPTCWFQHTTIVIETAHGEAGTGPKNATITVPIGLLYRNEEALAAVSALYILEDDFTSCISYISGVTSGFHGTPFTFGHPARLSNDTTVVGSIMCTRS